MYGVFFKIIWPYILRYLAGSAADYLEDRRQHRLAAGQAEAGRSASQSIDESPAEPADSSAGTPVEQPPAYDDSSGAFWYTLSGVLLGSAAGVMLAYLIRSEE